MGLHVLEYPMLGDFPPGALKSIRGFLSIHARFRKSRIRPCCCRRERDSLPPNANSVYVHEAAGRQPLIPPAENLLCLQRRRRRRSQLLLRAKWDFPYKKRGGGEERDPCSSRNVPNVRGISWPSSLQQPRRKRAVARSYVQKEGQGFDKQKKENRKQTKKNIFFYPVAMECDLSQRAVWCSHCSAAWNIFEKYKTYQTS